jgi:hypothetical protein
MSSSENIKRCGGPLSVHIPASAFTFAPASVRGAVVITRIRVEGVLSGRRCGPRARHERLQDKKCGERQMSVHRTTIPMPVFLNPGQRHQVAVRKRDGAALLAGRYLPPRRLV